MARPLAQRSLPLAPNCGTLYPKLGTAMGTILLFLVSLPVTGAPQGEVIWQLDTKG